MTFALNHLSYFLLTQELLPVLESTEGARVINTSSDAHERGKIDFDGPEVQRFFESLRITE